MKVAILQFAPELENIQANINKIKEFANQFQGIDLLILPELANSGYNFLNRIQALNCAESIYNSTFINFLQDNSRKFGCKIVTGFNELDNNHLYNSALLITHKGVEGHYRKIHLFMNEKDIFEQGNLG